MAHIDLCRRQSAEGRYISCSESLMIVKQSRKIGQDRGDKYCAWTIEAQQHGFELDLQ